jgi:hypothetical protein
MLSLLSCDKGYEIRFMNYYNEPMDSVLIGYPPQVIFTNMEKNTSSEYKKITRGMHVVRMVTKSRAHIRADVFVSSKGTGKRSIFIDAIGQISFLEE